MYPRIHISHALLATALFYLAVANSKLYLKFAC